jgi:hypothetical protein
MPMNFNFFLTIRIPLTNKFNLRLPNKSIFDNRKMDGTQSPSLARPDAE